MQASLPGPAGAHPQPAAASRAGAADRSDRASRAPASPKTSRVEARVVASILFSALYSPLTASIVPALVDHAERNEFQSLFALGLAGEGTDENMSVGMQLSVLCSEDAVRVTPADMQEATAGTLFGSHLLGNQLKACEMWPKGAGGRVPTTSRWCPTCRRWSCRAISIP